MMNVLDIQARMNKEKKADLTDLFNVICKDLNLDNVCLEVLPHIRMDSNADGLSYSAKTACIKVHRSFWEMVDSMAHELRHCYQFKNNFLVYDNGHKWMGKLCSDFPKLKDPSELDAESYAAKMVDQLN
jgi:hypothetical protein